MLIRRTDNNGLGSVDSAYLNGISKDPVDGTAPDLNNRDIWTPISSETVSKIIKNKAQVFDENGLPQKFSVQTDVSRVTTSTTNWALNNLPIWWSQLIDKNGIRILLVLAVVVSVAPKYGTEMIADNWSERTVGQPILMVEVNYNADPNLDQDNLIKR